MKDKQSVVNSIAELASEQPWHHNYILDTRIQTRPGLSNTLAGNVGKWIRISRLIKNIDVTDKQILDVGCSDGFYSIKLAQAGAKKVTGIDINEKRIEKAQFIQRYLGLDNVEFLSESIDSTFKDVKHNYDIIVCFGFLHRYPNPYDLINSLGMKTNMLILEWKLPQGSKMITPSLELAVNNRHGIDKFNISFFFPTFSYVETVLMEKQFKYFYRMDENQKRVVLLASKTPVEGLSKFKFVSRLSTLSRVYYFTKHYIKSIYKVILQKD